jgi:hypothetical protein
MWTVVGASLTVKFALVFPPVLKKKKGTVSAMM